MLALAKLLHRHRRPAVVTIGTFDGVHSGHRTLVGAARRLADARDLSTTALTFSPRPEQVLAPASALPDLCTLPERLQRLRAAGAHDVVVVPFSARLAALPAERFVRHLIDDLGAVALCVGVDFALGRDRAGDVPALRALGLEVVTVPLLLDSGGRKISSSSMRRAVAVARTA
jgi:riboflavin kinase / FMN adenylyltransferase